MILSFIGLGHAGHAGHAGPEAGANRWTSASDPITVIGHRTAGDAGCLGHMLITCETICEWVLGSSMAFKDACCMIDKGVSHEEQIV